MSKTNDNLMEAFAGESQANRKYLAYAKQAEKEGVAQETAAPSKAEVVEKVEEEKAVTAKTSKEEKAEAPIAKDTPKPGKEDAAVISEKKEKSEAKKAVKADSDDLTKIEGIGPKAAEALSNAGIDSYAKLAKANADKIKEILTEASSRMAHLDPGSWPKQAKMGESDRIHRQKP